jgi:hypothetical protein
VPHQQAGHMTAPDQCCINVKKLLSIRRRPHMTQAVIPVANTAILSRLQQEGTSHIRDIDYISSR